MTETTHRCPDCAVPMEEMDLQVGGRSSLAFLSGETREGLLGKLGLNQRYDGQAVVCPECGLARLYADIED